MAIELNVKRYRNIKTLILTSIAIVSTIFSTIPIYSARYVMFNDGELLPDGTIMLCQYEISRHGNPREVGDKDKVFIINSSGSLLREITKADVLLDQPHEAFVTNDGTIMVVNCRNDSIVEINDTNDEIWRYDLRKLNWTEYNASLFGPTSIVNNPEGDDWSHVNDAEVQIRNGSEYMLICVRNFDMVYEINLTAARMKSTPDPADITWHFGTPGDHSKLNQQHNADYLDNGNILVADSENNRIIEFNYTTGNIVYDSTGAVNLNWVRDADVNTTDPNIILITDSLNHRVIEFNRSSGEILWSYSHDLIQPYQSDYNPANANQIIITDGVGGKFIIIDKNTNEILLKYQIAHGSYEFAYLVFSMIILSVASNFAVVLLERFKLKEVEISKRKFNILAVVSISALVFMVISLFQPQWLLKIIVGAINVFVR
ncbi:MAG: aryl-sulfate sulfotransferase [Promethearchaeota archaeon]